jgi:hypothetical protein
MPRSSQISSSLGAAYPDSEFRLQTCRMIKILNQCPGYCSLRGRAWRTFKMGASLLTHSDDMKAPIPLEKFPSLSPSVGGPPTFATDTSNLTLKSPLASTPSTFPEGGHHAWATVAGAYVLLLLWHSNRHTQHLPPSLSDSSSNSVVLGLSSSSANSRNLNDADRYTNSFGVYQGHTFVKHSQKNMSIDRGCQTFTHRIT